MHNCSMHSLLTIVACLESCGGFTSSGGRGGGGSGNELGLLMTEAPEIALRIAANRTSVGLDEYSSSAVANYSYKINLYSYIGK